MKSKLLKSLSLICLMIVLNCTPNLISAENIKIESIDKKYIKFFGEAGLLDIKYSNIIYTTVGGKEIAQPVFKGDKGNIRYEDLRQYCIKMGKLQSMEGGLRPIQVYCKKNEVKKTFYEFIEFYKSNLLKDVDIEHPTSISQENETWTVRYDFKINGVPGSLTIDIDGSEESSPHYKSVYEIQPDENGGWFIYDISIKTTTP